MHVIGLYFSDPSKHFTIVSESGCTKIANDWRSRRMVNLSLGIRIRCFYKQTTYIYYEHNLSVKILLKYTSAIGLKCQCLWATFKMTIRICKRTQINSVKVSETENTLFLCQYFTSVICNMAFCIISTFNVNEVLVLLDFFMSYQI